MYSNNNTVLMLCKFLFLITCCYGYQVAGEQEVKGQVKLLFTDITQKPVTVTRTLISTQKVLSLVHLLMFVTLYLEMDSILPLLLGRSFLDDLINFNIPCISLLQVLEFLT